MLDRQGGRLWFAAVCRHPKSRHVFDPRPRKHQGGNGTYRAGTLIVPKFRSRSQWRINCAGRGSSRTPEVLRLGPAGTGKIRSSFTCCPARLNIAADFQSIPPHAGDLLGRQTTNHAAILKDRNRSISGIVRSVERPPNKLRPPSGQEYTVVRAWARNKRYGRHTNLIGERRSAIE